MWELRIDFNNQFQPLALNLEQISMQQESINRREQYKNQKLQQINQIYYCQCGKNYLTFSALYLHARNKHEVKLTTKRSNSICKIQKNQQKTIVTYFIQPKTLENQQQEVLQNSDQKKQNSSQQTPTTTKLFDIIDSFLNQDSSSPKAADISQKLVINLLKQYISQLTQLDQSYFPSDIEGLTLYFNQFIVYFIPLSVVNGSISSLASLSAESAIIKFWRWLRQNDYTTVQLLHRSQSQSIGII